MSIGDEARALLAEGLTVTEVAERLGTTWNTIAYHRDAVVPQPQPVADRRSTVRRVQTREAVAELLGAGLSRAEVARSLGVTKSTVAYHARRLGLPRDERGARRYDWAAVRAFYDEGHTVDECVEAFGFSRETWHAAVKRGDGTARSRRIPDEELFACPTRRSRHHLKCRMLEAGLRASRCEVCSIDSWREQPLSLALHHINGDVLDNRLENLQLLCPNCHSQTDNFSGRKPRASGGP